MLNKVEICGLDTSKLPMMTQKRSHELLLRVKAGDEEARECFIRENLRLVLSVIQRFAGRGEQMDDLFQVGCIGMIKALDNFDLSHNVRFSTYAVPMEFVCRNAYFSGVKPARKLIRREVGSSSKRIV